MKTKNIVKTREMYILIHGLTPFTMSTTMIKYELALQARGVPLTDIIRVGYTARGHTFPEIAEKYHQKLLNALYDVSDFGDTNIRLNFICHSLGGLMARYSIPKLPGFDIGKIIMLGTPNQGVDWVDQVPQGKKLGRLLFGPNIIDSLMDLTYFQIDLPRLRMYDVTCIAGTKQHTTWNPLSWMASSFLDEEHDGFVPTRAVEGVGGYCIKPLKRHVDHLGMILDGGFIKEVVDIATGEV